jgi:hypothetical protein
MIALPGGIASVGALVRLTVRRLQRRLAAAA